MRRLLIVRVLIFGIASTILSACAHFSAISEFPSEYAQRLSNHPEWLTITAFDNAPGVFPPAEVSVIKKWRVTRAGDGQTHLDEIQSSSFVGLMDAVRRHRPEKQHMVLAGRIDPVAFFPFPGHALKKRRRFAPDQYAFRDIDGERFEILVNGVGRIVFFPSQSKRGELTAAKSHKDIGIWTQPFGPEGELVTHILHLISKSEVKELPAALEPGDFLHHDPALKKPIKVRLQEGFPDRYRGSLERALKLWNAGYGVPLFEFERSSKKLSPGDCLSSMGVCIKWVGSPEIALTGANGYTELGFDPETGRISGAVIYVINDDVTPPLAALSAEDLRKYKSLDEDWILDSTRRYGEFNRVRHPDSQQYMEYLFTHELGHLSGLGHNFLADASTTAERPTVSVMSYPPFAVAHRANYLGQNDRQRISMIYHAKELEPTLRYCSTFDAMGPEVMKPEIYHRPASCDMFTLGDPAEWYIRLAARGADGVFTTYPDLSSLTEDLQALYRQLIEEKLLPPMNILSRLGVILADPAESNGRRRRRVQDYLCGLGKDVPSVTSQLKTYQHVKLVCPLTSPLPMSRKE